MTALKQARGWRHARVVAAAAVIGLVPSLASSSSTYSFTKLDVPFARAFQTTATGINDKGQIVGFYIFGELLSRGFLLENGRFTSFEFTACCTDAHGINNAGDIVGTGASVGFLDSDGSFTTIDVSRSSFTGANGINTGGDIVGDTIVSNQAMGYLLRGGSFTFITGSTRALGINDLGQIVGTSSVHGYLLSGGVSTPIDYPGALNTTPTGINNAGVIVGWYQAPSLASHGFMLDSQGFSTIDVTGSTSTQVFGINNAGQLVGEFTDSNGTHGFLATPTVDDLVSFNPISSTFATTSATTACPGGEFSFRARLTNTSNRSLSHLVVKVTTLTNGNLLQNADGGPGGVGALLTIPATGAYADGMLSPGEFVDVSFVICLHTSGGFTFFVDVLGNSK